jgi:hypothetical protein
MTCSLSTIFLVQDWIPSSFKKQCVSMNVHWKGTSVESLPIGSGRADWVGGIPTAVAPLDAGKDDRIDPWQEAIFSLL